VLILTAVTYGSLWILVVSPNGYSLWAAIVAYAAASAAFLGITFLLIGPDLRDTISRLPQLVVPRRATGVS